MTAFHMYQEADKQDGPNADIAHLFDPFNLKQGYIIALGVNDLKGKNNLNDLYEGNVGSAKTDICLEDYNKNAKYVCWLVRKDYPAYSEDAASHQIFSGNNAR